MIELQTPTFERLILSFAQKVLTQDHWDTRAAVACMRLDNPQASETRVLTSAPDCTVERVVDFDGLAARRVRLAPAARMRLPTDLPYALCIGISGELSLGDVALEKETACLVPGSAAQRTLVNDSGADAVCLLAGPGL